MADVEYTANLDDDAVLKALRRIDKNIDGIAKRGNSAFGNIGGSATKAGAVMGGVGGVVGALTEKFIELGARAIEAFQEIIAQGIELNKQFELSQQVFTNLFDDPDLGAATIRFLRTTADELRVNQGEAIKFAQNILPRTSDLDTFRELLRLTDIQADTTGQSISELEFSIREALSGDFVSLKDRFDISRETVNQIKELGKEIGLDKALAEVLGDEFERLGKVNLEGALQTDLKDIQSQFTNLQVALTDPIFNQLKEQAAEFLETLRANGDELTLIAGQIGDVLAGILEFIGDGFQQAGGSIDLTPFQEFVSFVQDTFEAVKLLASELIDFGGQLFGLVGDVSLLDEEFSVLVHIISRADEAMVTLTQILGFSRAGIEGLRGTISPTVELIDRLAEAIIALFNLDYEGFAESIDAANEAIEDGFFDLEEGQRRAVDAIQETAARLDNYNQRLDENTRKQEERKQATDDTTKADRAAIDAALARKQAEEDLSKAAEAQKEIDEARAKAAEENEQELTKIRREQAEQRLDDAIKAAQRREDIERKSAQAIEDIFTKNAQVIEDAARDLSRDEADIARKAARDRQQIERDSASQRQDVERNFRIELQRIRDQFQQAAQEAERNNDAQAFLRAQRQQEQQVSQAEQTRDTGLEDAAREAEEKREALKVQLDHEIEDAQIANARKLEDLQIRLDRELEKRALKNQRALEEQAIQEERLAERRALEFQRELEEFARKEEEKQAKLEESLAEQFAALEAAKEAEVALIAETEAAKTGIVREEEKKRRKLQEQLTAGGDNTFGTNTRGVGSGGLRPFQRGGRPGVGEPVVVGEAGPEVFVPDTAGTIIPNTTMFRQPVSPPPITPQGGSVTNNSIVQNLSESMFNDPVQRNALRNFILATMAEAQGGAF